MRLAVVFALVGALGCSNRSPGDAPPSPPAPPSVDPRPRPPPAPAEDPGCATARQLFETVLENAPGTCESAADCDCAPGGVSERARCGAVTDRDTAAQLFTIRDRFHASGCEAGWNCAARACAPECVGGRCQ